MLPARHLQKSPETSIYKHAEIGKAELSLKNMISDGGGGPVGGQSGRGAAKT
jgi:hypothetical protein